MEFITRQLRANNVVEAWHNQYKDTRNDIAIKLNKLGKIKDPDDVDKIIGNKSWTHIHCDECGCISDRGIIFGVDEYDRPYCYICDKCLHKAIELMKQS